jgi:hypothetical protein
MVAIETKKQTVAVTGVVACNQKVVSGATVELWERDTCGFSLQATSNDFSRSQ